MLAPPSPPMALEWRSARIGVGGLRFMSWMSMVAGRNASALLIQATAPRPTGRQRAIRSPLSAEPIRAFRCLFRVRMGVMRSSSPVTVTMKTLDSLPMADTSFSPRPSAGGQTLKSPSCGVMVAACGSLPQAGPSIVSQPGGQFLPASHGFGLKITLWRFWRTLTNILCQRGTSRGNRGLLARIFERNKGDFICVSLSFLLY